MKNRLFFTILQLIVLCISTEAIGQQVIPDSLYIDDFEDIIEVYEQHSYQGDTTYQFLSVWMTNVGTTSYYTEDQDYEHYTFRSFIYLTEDEFDDLLSIEDDINVTGVKIQYKSRVGSTFKIVNINENLPTYGGTQAELKEDWQKIKNGNSIGANSLIGNGSFETNIFNNHLQSLSQDYNHEFGIILGMISNHEEDSTSSGAIDEFKITVLFDRVYDEVTVTARNDYHNSDGGNIGVGIDDDPQSFPSPKTISNAYEKQILKLAAYDNQTIDGDLTVFNNTEAPEEKSRWERRKDGQQPDPFATGNQTPTYGALEAPRDDDATFAAILRGKYTISRNDYSPETGSNINSANVTVIEGNTLTAPSTQTDGGVDYTFYEWSDGETDNPRTIDSPTPSSLTAYYKALQRSNNDQTWAAHQRNIVRSSDGWQHMVYESIGHIWYEVKAPGGNWQLMGRQGVSQPEHVDQNGGRSPSIDFYGYSNDVVMAWQEGNTIKVENYWYSSSDGSYVREFQKTINPGESSSYDLNPSVAWSNIDEFVVVWNSSNGIHFQVMERDCAGTSCAGIAVIDNGVLSGTDSNSKKPAVSSDKNTASTTFFDIAWEQQGSSTTQVKYKTIYRSGGSYSQYPSTPIQVSSSSVWQNTDISITSLDDGPRIGWVANHNPGYHMSNAPLKAAVRNPLSGQINEYDDYIRSVGVGKQDDVSDDYYLGWSRKYNTQRQNKFKKGSSASLKSLNTTGEQVQIVNGDQESDMYVMSYVNHSSPYRFSASNSLGSYLKQARVTTGHGRGISLAGDSAGITYMAKHIAVDNQMITFVETGDKVPHQARPTDEELTNRKAAAHKADYQKEEFTSFLISAPFKVAPGMSFQFEDEVVFADKAALQKWLGKSGEVTFITELVDPVTYEPLMKLRSLTVNQSSVPEHGPVRWAVDARSMPAAEVRLRITAETNMETRALLVSSQMNLEALREKAGDVRTIQPEASEKITEYGLAQNYPNPFNPSTVISY